MKFLVDAQLPRRLVYRLIDAGHEAMHTLDLPQRNHTSDGEIEDISHRERQVVVTKDSDFVNSFLLHRKPYKLLLVSTGNINNQNLESLFLDNIEDIVKAFENHDFIELGHEQIIIHV